jgi:hypothetical protein
MQEQILYTSRIMQTKLYFREYISVIMNGMNSVQLLLHILKSKGNFVNFSIYPITRCFVTNFSLLFLKISDLVHTKRMKLHIHGIINYELQIRQLFGFFDH